MSLERSEAFDIVIHNTVNGLRLLFWSIDFQKSMIMRLSLLTGRAEVKVLADTAFVSWTNYRKHFAASTFHFWVSYTADLLLINLIAIVKFLEYLSTLLLQLCLDEALENLSWHTLFASGHNLFLFRI